MSVRFRTICTFSDSCTVRKEETDGRESTMVRRKKYKRQEITGKTPHLSVRFPLWYLSCHALVRHVPHCGTTNTALWYERYQRLVLRVPSRGISRYILSYDYQELTIIFPERYLRRSLSPTSGTYSASLRFILYRFFRRMPYFCEMECMESPSFTI